MHMPILRFCLLCCSLLFLQAAPLHAHEGHDHGLPLAVSAVFDAEGVLWRAGVKGGIVTVDKSQDMGRTFVAAGKLNAKPQKVGTDGDARPKIAVGPEGNIYVSWTQALAKPYTGYIWFSRSTDGGKTFSAPVIVHGDRAEITHRFDALTVAANGRVYVAWVDKRDLVAAKARKRAYDGAAIYYAYSDDAGGSFSAEQKLADNSCECCRIALTTDAAGNAVALWRHLFDGGVRDHAIAKFSDAPVTGAKRASFGGWKIDACPHHGPAIARGEDWGWHMAWFDGGEKTGLFYARMDGEAWVSSPARRFGDADQQAGHPALMSRGEQVWLVWKELTDASAIIKMAVSDDGGKSWSDAARVAETAGNSDHPQLLAYQDGVFLGWNTAGGLVIKKLTVDKAKIKP
ncbi:hypothetical protein MTYP_01350 [Methylophilaceae bacterium]|nr:hypothetical protein MTYP_01350 [Methylophilaceae bacterium]